MALLLGAEGYKLLEKYGIPVARYAVISDRMDLASLAQDFGFPLVIKAISPQLLHKTEAGAVRIVNSLTEAMEAFDSMEKLSNYIMIQKFIPGIEVIIGAKHDETFGKVILFGGGGVFVEVQKDVSFRVCPISSKDTQMMIGEVKFSSVLKGFRGKKPADIGALQKILQKVCQLANKENVQELDLNPVIVNEHGAIAVDVRIVI